MGHFPNGFSWATLALACLCTSVVTRTTIDLNRKSATDSELYCTTGLCQQLGKVLVANQNPKIDACVDFYSHACGERLTENSFGYSMHKLYAKLELESRIQDQLKSLLERSDPSDNGAVKKAKTFYESCTNEDVINQRGIAPVLSLISENGGWPLTSSSNELLTNGNLTLQTIYENYLSNGAFWPLVRIGMTHSNMQTEERTLMTQWQIPPSKEWELLKVKSKENNVQTYKSYMETVIKDYVRSGGFNVSSESVEKDVQDILTFEYKLWDVVKSVRRSWNTQCDNCISTIGDFQDKWNSLLIDRPELQIDWLKLIRSSFEKTNIEIVETEKIFLHPTENLTKIADMLEKTPMRTIVNYIQWYVIYNTLTFTNVHRRLIDGHQFNERPVWCLEEPELARAYSHMYVKKYLSNESLTLVTNMALRIQNEMKREISDSTYLSNADKLLLIERINGRIVLIGQPDSYNDPEQNDEYYNELAIGPNFFENALKLRSFYEIKRRESYRGPDVPQEWSGIAAEPHFDWENNLLAFPAGGLQMPLFHPNMPASMNYGATGVSMGLKLASSISGGVYREDNAELPESARKMYDEHVACVSQRHNENVKDEENVHAAVAKKYFIDDHNGVKLALKAFLSYVEDKENSKAIGIRALKNLSSEKIFFYSAANYFCAKHDVFYEAADVSIGQLRFNSALSEIKDFSEAFDCPLGSPMNPLKKCSAVD